ncbi:hypothetical protein D5H75_23120 [Bailinhaonella thermotolerans]|uniref:Glycerophosphoryl diester phosphodiesterase membrane domain-containing protein n=1 Tax=Bailinhaonella thermotolerans TaxID=1070861 RepID=A0A3A4ANB6_9ACTN|nr:hypothetical protein D5H75_23120 [Bailinhaonella thermotolerans]
MSGVTQVVLLLLQLLIADRLVPDLDVLSQAGVSVMSSLSLSAQLANLGMGLLESSVAVVLTGILTAVVGRAVLGRAVSAGEAWRLAKPRLPTLFGLAGINLAIVLIWAVVGFGPAVAVSFTTSEVGVVVGVFLLGLLVSAPVAVFFWVKVSLAAPAAVFEQCGVGRALRRSAALVKGDWWRVFGIQLLAVVITILAGMLLMIPFALIGGIVTAATLNGDGGGVGVIASTVILTLGAIVVSTVISPFSAGVVALLYADRRMRAEAFDLVLQTGVSQDLRPAFPGAPDPVDDLWRPTPAH